MEIPDLSNLNLPLKEQKILEAAIRVFSEKGFSAATTSEIAKNAGIAEGTIFRYFKTKKDILRGILIHTINAFSGKLIMESIEKILLSTENKDLHTVVKEVLVDRLKLVDKIFPMARIILTEALFHEDVMEALYQNIILRALESFKVFHQRMAERGLMRSDIDSVTLLRSIIGTTGALVFQKKLLGNKLALLDDEKELDMVVDILIYGISSRDC